MSFEKVDFHTEPKHQTDVESIEYIQTIEYCTKELITISYDEQLMKTTNCSSKSGKLVS